MQVSPSKSHSPRDWERVLSIVGGASLVLCVVLILWAVLQTFGLLPYFRTHDYKWGFCMDDFYVWWARDRNVQQDPSSGISCSFCGISYSDSPAFTNIIGLCYGRYHELKINTRPLLIVLAIGAVVPWIRRGWRRSNRDGGDDRIKRDGSDQIVGE